MDLTNTITDLREQLARIDDAIKALEHLAHSRNGGPKPGTKPAGKASPNGPKRRKRKPMSAETRRKMAESQRKRFAAKQVGPKNQD